jgi:hypothetical protein
LPESVEKANQSCCEPFQCISEGEKTIIPGEKGNLEIRNHVNLLPSGGYIYVLGTQPHIFPPVEVLPEIFPLQVLSKISPL